MIYDITHIKEGWVTCQKTNILQIETEMIYYMCLNWINTLFKKNPVSCLKPVCLIARYIYFPSNEMNQNTENKEQYVSKNKKHDIEWKKRTIKVRQQLHLYIRFHSAPTNQRRIITCILYKREIRQNVIKCTM